jgi:hypothetical protein
MWNASNDVLYVKAGRILRPHVNITCSPGGTHQRCRPCNRYLSKIRDNVILTGSIPATAAVVSSSAGDGLSSSLVSFDRKRPTNATRTGRKGHKEIGGGIEGGWARTLCATVAVSQDT